jgi:hypothetical protein
MPPLLARRIKWYQDRDFNPATAMSVLTVALWLVIAVAAAIIVSELTGGK